MENIIKVSMFESAQSRYASGVVNLWDWLFLEDYRTVLIKELRNESDSMKRRELKKLLPAITVSCVCSERRTEKIYEYTNLICIDIDGKDNPSISNIEDLKIKLGELPYIMYVDCLQAEMACSVSFLMRTLLIMRMSLKP